MYERSSTYTEKCSSAQVKSQTESFNNPKTNPKTLLLGCYISLSAIVTWLRSLLLLCHCYLSAILCHDYFFKGPYILQTTIISFIQGSHVFEVQVRRCECSPCNLHSHTGRALCLSFSRLTDASGPAPRCV